MDEWDEDDEMGVAAAFVMAFTIGFVATTIIGVAIAWHAVDAVVSLVRTVRRS
jgi:hypothetical protein